MTSSFSDFLDNVDVALAELLLRRKNNLSFVLNHGSKKAYPFMQDNCRASAFSYSLFQGAKVQLNCLLM